MQLKDHQKKAVYPVYSASVEKWDDLVLLKPPSSYFTLLVVAVFSLVGDNVLKTTAIELIRKGLLHYCTWGPGSKRAHLQCDLANIEFNDIEGTDYHVMTTSHEHEPLDEALWFALFLATADNRFWDDCCTVIVTVQNKSWAQTLDTSLNDIEAFNQRMVNKA